MEWLDQLFHGWKWNPPHGLRGAAPTVEKESKNPRFWSGYLYPNGAYRQYRHRLVTTEGTSKLRQRVLIGNIDITSVLPAGAGSTDSVGSTVKSRNSNSELLSVLSTLCRLYC
jgi:hypothetical protein